MFKRLFFGTFMLATSAVQAAGPAHVKSSPLTPDIKVDGVITDWTVLSPLKGVSVAAANDQDRLVVVIATSEPSVKQRLLAAGLIVYIDPRGKKDKAFGVRIPPGRSSAMGRSAGRSGPPPGGGAPPVPGDGAPPPSGPLPPVTYVEVLGPGKKESRTVELATRSGFEAGRGDNEGTLVIEVAIPLRQGEGIAVAAPIEPSRTVVGLGLVTPDPPQGRGQPGGGGPAGGPGGRGGGGVGGGMPPGGGMGGGRGGGMPPGGGMGGPPPGADQGKALNVWTTLDLAGPRTGL